MLCLDSRNEKLKKQLLCRPSKTISWCNSFQILIPNLNPRIQSKCMFMLAFNEPSPLCQWPY